MGQLLSLIGLMDGQAIATSFITAISCFRDILDTAIVSTEAEAKLLLNPLSPQYEQMKTSSLPKHLGNAVIDPIELEKEGQTFLVEGDVDRNNKEAVLRYGFFPFKHKLYAR